MKFQFRNGSIKRFTQFTINITAVRFNSEMVRLKVDDAGTYSTVATRFNSEMVRLKVFGFKWRS